MNLENEFIPYKQALALKELGFDEPCLRRYEINDISLWMSFGEEDHVKNSTLTEFEISAPLYQQAFRWFREKCDCHHTIQRNKKYVGIAYSSIVNFSIDEFNTYEEAELACLKKLIEIVK